MRTAATEQKRLGSDGGSSIAYSRASFRILTNLRDEAHRFAIGYHRKLRQRIGSELDEIPGLGPTRRRALLRHFGSLEGLRRASLAELRAVKGLPGAVAEAVHAKYRGGEDAAEPKTDG
ncbi:MAG: hypothetical protein CSA62_10495 [Planctomycetota bacterium]|nr:MAG: hypothetical protein CSA62_10495 [Planctomycetota bacterium]